MVRTVLRGLALLAVAIQFVAAAPALVTVANPFGSPAPTVSAVLLGVDSEGRTRYGINEDVMFGESTLALNAATLVEGSDYVSYGFSFTSVSATLALGWDCTVPSSGNPICSDLGTPTSGPVPSLVLDVVSTAAAQATAIKPSSSQKIQVSVFGTLAVGLAIAHQLV
ncbi:hypothetical protein C8R44DRAFT_868222 [Mycena epipterygia]|nr:hypothetical protein C8R44DRAFT_868222 [Mycena epipterygia]